MAIRYQVTTKAGDTSIISADAWSHTADELRFTRDGRTIATFNAEAVSTVADRWAPGIILWPTVSRTASLGTMTVNVLPTIDYERLKSTTRDLLIKALEEITTELRANKAP
jgi:hypothetical protein